MSVFYDKTTVFFIGDSDLIPLQSTIPSKDEIDEAFSKLILSASGWRKVFAISGDEEDFTDEIGDANRVLAAHMADVFAHYLLDRTEDPVLVLGIDTRPTGPQIADIMCRVFLARGISIRHVFIAAAPEIMAYARSADAFVYISASHNPVGHNGVKFGLSDGGVLPGSETAKLIQNFKAACADDKAAEIAEQLVSACPKSSLERVYTAIPAEKGKSLAAYRAFTQEVVSGTPNARDQQQFLNLFTEKPGISILVDFNGSARTCSIDRNFFAEAGIFLSIINGEPRQIAHRIVPEGGSLSFCANEIERLHREGKNEAERNTVLGYVPDCDGDRGNIVFWNENKQKAEPLEAQDVFALSVIAELSHLAYQGQFSVMSETDMTGRIIKRSEPPVAVAVNGPTSLRIEAIADAFGVRIARAEVGEANVVNLARKLRTEGYIVRILGEGSNGGNITHPSAVRDPIDTVFALLKLLAIRDTPQPQGLFHLWCTLSGQEERYRDGFTLADIKETIPRFVTTSVFEKEAMLRISTTDHGLLKGSFQTIFLRDWETKKAMLHERYGFASWIAVRNNGIEEERGIRDFALSGKGGLKIQFFDDSGTAAGFIWMRGSGTEPVFRILADIRGTKAQKERELLDWLTQMVLEADSKI